MGCSTRGLPISTATRDPEVVRAHFMCRALYQGNFSVLYADSFYCQPGIYTAQMQAGSHSHAKEWLELYYMRRRWCA